MKTVTKTVKEVFEALKKNGFEHIRGDWFNTYDGLNPKAACVLGQAAINLNVAAFYDEEELGVYDELDWDYGPYTVEAQLNRFEVKGGRWYTYITGAGSSIIHWNDKVNIDGNWHLKTYEEVVGMAHDILEPYFNETVELAVHDYEVSPLGSVST